MALPKGKRKPKTHGAPAGGGKENRMFGYTMEEMEQRTRERVERKQELLMEELGKAKPDWDEVNRLTRDIWVLLHS